MKIFLNIIIFFIFSLNAISSQLSFDFYAFYSWNKVIDINKDRKFVIFDTNGMGETSIGVAMTGGCDGFLEYLKEEIDRSYYICKIEEGNGDTSFFEMRTERGEAGSGITPFTFIEGTGRWKELVGLGCMGAFSMIKGFNENMKNASIIFKAKCEIPDVILERLKNYKKHQS